MSDQSPTSEALSFESQLAELETLVERLEQGDIPLADAVAAYEAGLRHAQACEQLLEQAQKRLDELGSVAGDSGEDAD